MGRWDAESRRIVFDVDETAPRSCDQSNCNILATAGPVPIGEHAWRHDADLVISVTALVSDADIESHAAGVAAEKAAVLAAAINQLHGIAGVAIEGLPLPEYNSVYLPAGSHEGWPRFEGGEGTHLFRHVEYAHSFVDWRRPLFFLGRLWPSRNRFSVVLCRLLNSWRQEG